MPGPDPAAPGGGPAAPRDQAAPGTDRSAPGAGPPAPAAAPAAPRDGSGGAQGASGPDADALALLLAAAGEAGRIALSYWRRSPPSREKPGGAGPVSDADLAVDRFLRETLLAARPGTAWLSEETPDDPAARRAADECWIVDPIDGTRPFLAGEPDWNVSAALTRGGRPVAAVVHLPARGETYAATRGGGAVLNGAPLRAEAPAGPPRLLASRQSMAPARWPRGVPDATLHWRHALAWRFCLVAAGRYDALLTHRPAWYWDVCAGSLVAAEAGCTVTDLAGRPLAFDAEHPQTPGAVAAPAALHPALIP